MALLLLALWLLSDVILLLFAAILVAVALRGAADRLSGATALGPTSGAADCVAGDSELSGGDNLVERSGDDRVASRSQQYRHSEFREPPICSAPKSRQEKDPFWLAASGWSMPI